jgi:UDP-N-acetylglucosamine 2-epimerase
METLRIVYPYISTRMSRNPFIACSAVPNITLLPPLDYRPLVHLLKHARLVLTSGGLRKKPRG